KKQKTTFDEKKATEYLSSRAEWNAKWLIILENLAKIENLEVNDSELENLANEESKMTGISKDKLLNFYIDSGKKESLLEEKVIQFLKDSNIVNETNPELNKDKGTK
ncbi:hypothetical protein ACFLS9_09070, partial [Bacteroidota bacterium]